MKETYNQTLFDAENVFYKRGNFIIRHHFLKNCASEMLSISSNTFSKSILKILPSTAQCVLPGVGDLFFNLSLEMGKVCWSSLIYNALQMSP